MRNDEYRRRKRRRFAFGCLCCCGTWIATMLIPILIITLVVVPPPVVIVNTTSTATTATTATTAAATTAAATTATTTAATTTSATTSPAPYCNPNFTQFVDTLFHSGQLMEYNQTYFSLITPSASTLSTPSWTYPFVYSGSFASVFKDNYLTFRTGGNYTLVRLDLNGNLISSVNVNQTLLEIYDKANDRMYGSTFAYSGGYIQNLVKIVASSGALDLSISIVNMDPNKYLQTFHCNPIDQSIYYTIYDFVLTNVYLTKLNSLGAFQWQILLSSPFTVYNSISIKTDTIGDVFVLAVDPNGPNGNSDGVVFKFDQTNGNQIWYTEFGTPSYEYPDGTPHYTYMMYADQANYMVFTTPTILNAVFSGGAIDASTGSLIFFNPVVSEFSGFDGASLFQDNRTVFFEANDGNNNASLFDFCY